jgi:hypothetical protein
LIFHAFFLQLLKHVVPALLLSMHNVLARNPVAHHVVIRHVQGCNGLPGVNLN